MDYIKLFRNKNFTLLYFGQFISSIGSGINFMGITVYTLRFGDSLANLGLLLLLLKLPSVILGPLAGTFADMFNRKYIIITCDIIRGILGIILFFNQNLFTFFILVFCLSIFDVLFAPAIGGFLPKIIGKGDLVTANSLYASSIQLTKLIGPAIGGLLISLFSVNIIFIINGISFILSGVSEMFITYRDIEHDKTLLEKLNLLEGIKEGVKYINTKKEIKFIVIFFAISSIAFGALPILYVSYINNNLAVDSDIYGFFMTINSIGILLGSFLIKKTSKLLGEFKTMIYGLGVFGILYLMFGTINFVPGNLFLFFSIGVAAALINISYGIFLQKNVDNKILGRVYSFDMALSNTMIVLVTLFITFFGDYIKTQNLIIMFSCFIISMVLLALNSDYYKTINKVTVLEVD